MSHANAEPSPHTPKDAAVKTTKILLPLATLVAAGAVAVGSGATFTSTSANTISSVTSGTLTQSNSKASAAIFSLTNIKPGDTVNGGLTITNTGSLPATFSLTEVASTNGFAGSNLSLTITNTTTNKVIYTGTFGGLADGVKNDLGLVAPGVANNYTFNVKLDSATPNTDQGKTASATFQWDSVQADATTTNQ
jgi:spore coat-associated protein N